MILPYENLFQNKNLCASAKIFKKKNLHADVLIV
jgi:hypothetical protein